jgi:hypothetical protein
MLLRMGAGKTPAGFSGAPAKGLILAAGIVPGLRPREDSMGEHILHKKETKKAPQKTLKEKRKEKKNKEKGAGTNIPNS